MKIGDFFKSFRCHSLAKYTTHCGRASVKALQEGFSLQELNGWTWEALLVRRIVFHQFVEQFAVFGNPGGVAIIGNGGKDLFETLNQLASMLIQWEVEQWAWDSTGLVKVAHWSLADENGATEVLELG